MMFNWSPNSTTLRSLHPNKYTALRAAHMIVMQRNTMNQINSPSIHLSAICPRKTNHLFAVSLTVFP